MTKKEVAVHSSTEIKMIDTIADIVRNPDVDIEKMDKLLDIQIKMMDRQAKMDYDQALSRIQALMPRISANGTIKNRAGEVTSRYMTYEDIDKVIRPLLQEEGFALMHDRRDVNGKMVVKTTLKHRNGHEQSVEIPLPYDQVNALKNAIQAAVSTYSYGKRVNVCSLLNIVAEGEDDDGQLSCANKIDEDQVKEIKSFIKKLSDASISVDEKKFTAYLGAESIEDIPASKYDIAKQLLMRKEREAKNG